MAEDNDIEIGSVAMMERFATLVAQGVDPATAYIDAGYGAGQPCGSRASQNAMKLLSDDVIAQRIKDIQVSQPIATREWVLQSLQKVFHAAFTTQKFASCNKALQLIGTEIGMFKSMDSSGVRKRLDDMSVEELTVFAAEVESEINRVAGIKVAGPSVAIQ